MLSREDERYLRVPSVVTVTRSPVAARRRFPYQYQPTHTARRDDGHMDPRHRQRDPSPGGLGRLSTSAPSEDSSVYWAWRHREPRHLPADRADGTNNAVSVYGRARDQRPLSDHIESGGYATMPGHRRSRVPSPRNSRVMMSSSMPPGTYLNPLAHAATGTGGFTHKGVNGDVMVYRGSCRPKSFPDQRGTYLYEPPRQQESAHGYDPRHCEPSTESRHRKQRSPVHSAGSVVHNAGSSVYSAGSSAPSTGSSTQSGASSRSTGDASPCSDEAMSSVTLTAERAACPREHSPTHGSLGREWGYAHEDGLQQLMMALACYLCGQPFRRPRILPCGHTFCTECLTQLKEETLRDGRPMLGSTCTSEGRHKPDLGVQFVCPMPECRYSMRLMNLGRWSTRNKAVSDAVAALRVTLENKQETATQTDITMDSMLVTIPRSLLEEALPPGTDRRLMRRNSASLMDRMVHRALSMDSLSNSYIPRQHVTWRSYVAMLGMHILQQVIHT